MIRKTLYLSMAGLLWLGCGAKEEQSVPEATVKVKVAKVSLEAAPEVHSFSGKVLSSHTINLSTKLLGRIDFLSVEEGEKVKAGQTLVRVSSEGLQAKRTSIQANQQEAEANFRKVRKDFHRIETLYQKKSATEKELDEISYALEASKAKVTSLKNAMKEVDELLTYAHIRSPFDGYVTRKFMDKGDLATPGMPMLMIESFQELKVVAKIPEHQLKRITVNDEVEIEIGSLDKWFTGTVTQLNPSSVAGNLQFEATIKLPKEANDEVKTGMYARVKVTSTQGKKIMIPRKAIVRQGQLNGIYTVNSQGKTTLRWLRLGKEFGNKVEVLSGLQPGEHYIAASEDKLEDGLTVQLIN